MKFLSVLILFTCFSCTLLYASGGDGKLQDTKTFDQAAIAGITKLQVDIKGTNGGILIEQHDEPGIRAEVYGSSIYWNKELSAGEVSDRIKQYDIQMEARKDRGDFLITVNQVSGGYQDGLKVSIKLYVPEAYNTDINTSGGDVQFRNYTGGEHTVKSSGGEIALNGFKGTMDGDTNGGETNVLMAEGDITLRTSGGNAWLAGLDATLDLDTDGGNINADMSALRDFVRINTGGGSIQIAFPEEASMALDVMASTVYVTGNTGSSYPSKGNFKKKYGAGNTPVTINAGPKGIVRLLTTSAE
ncbi:DUF4097 family beta strand repeat-containing protein [Roseivirga sp. BDSF3-8]|uniref:DUF4097 family beta strand repeat-containing protein n=1 Tax=Roseivirga sp. BDSF3-8 TaxID=3241598 RepID=UPI0035325A18